VNYYETGALESMRDLLSCSDFEPKMLITVIVQAKEVHGLAQINQILSSTFTFFVFLLLSSVELR
jgi:hypothetical protein